jgi:hypothetical protein
MGALASARLVRREKWQYYKGTLKTGNVGYKGGLACVEQATGKVVKGASGAGLIPIGIFDETVDATAADAAVRIRLFREIEITFFVNGTAADAVAAATDFGKTVYVLDDQTVSVVATGKSALGVVWAVDANKGVAVEVK